MLERMDVTAAHWASTWAAVTSSRTVRPVTEHLNYAATVPAAPPQAQVYNPAQAPMGVPAKPVAYVQAAQPVHVVIEGFVFQPGPNNWKFGLCGWSGNGGICECKPGMCEAFIMASCCASCRVAQMAGRVGHSMWIGIAVLFIIAQGMTFWGSSIETSPEPTFDYYCNYYYSYYGSARCTEKFYIKVAIKAAVAVVGWIGMTIALTVVRRAVVNKYQIHETACCSWALSCCCGFYSLYQVSAEVDFSERGRLDSCSADCKVCSARLFVPWCSTIPKLPPSARDHTPLCEY
jgi:hypothetical protein